MKVDFLKQIPSQVETYEFERTFLCSHFPEVYDDGTNPNLIIQSYILSSEGYCIRVRVQSNKVNIPMSPEMDVKKLLINNWDHFDEAFITIKGPMIDGTRYEAEHPLEINAAIELINRAEVTPIIKNRHSFWHASDGWIVDIFGGANSPLIVAECERTNPVTNLTIPNFCKTEVTRDARFSNDQLSLRPYSTFKDEVAAELAVNGATFLDCFGTNTFE